MCGSPDFCGPGLDAGESGNGTAAKVVLIAKVCAFIDVSRVLAADDGQMTEREMRRCRLVECRRMYVTGRKMEEGRRSGRGE